MLFVEGKQAQKIRKSISSKVRTVIYLLISGRERERVRNDFLFFFLSKIRSENIV